MFKPINAILSFLLSLPVLFYKHSISPILRPACRHVPTCSQYMLDALKIHGPFKGLILGTGRILRCRPGGTHGYDPVQLFRFRKYRPLSTIFTKWAKENRLKRNWAMEVGDSSSASQRTRNWMKSRFIGMEWGISWGWIKFEKTNCHS